MSNITIHPKLSNLLPFDKIPNELESLRDALESVFDEIFVKNLIASQSYDGSSGYYTLTLTTQDSLGFNIPLVDGLKIVFNPTVEGSTELPISFGYSWIILKYINDFSLDSFDNAIKSSLYILMDLANVNEEILFRDMLYNLFPGYNSLMEFTQNYNQLYNNTLTVSTDNNKTFDEKTDLIIKDIENQDKELLEVIYDLSININNEGLDRLKKLFINYFDNIEKSIKEAITLNFNASINNVSVGLQFPHKWLRPVYTGSENVSGVNLDDPLPDNFYSFLTFDVGSFSYNSSNGFVFNNINAFNLNRSMIGKTGLIAEFQGLKIDLKSDSNIPEADADGRDLTFKGVYAEFVDIALPKKWFKKQGSEVQQTLKLFGRRLLIGSGGGISGTIGLEALVLNNPIGENDYLKYELGENSGFKIGFNRFDITFKQNKVVNSNIRAMLEIPKLDQPIEIQGTLDSDFNTQIAA